MEHPVTLEGNIPLFRYWIIETCYLKDILASLPELPPHNWLITDLECYDSSGWDGCEKWAESQLFLTDEALRRDVSLRNMQVLWGVFPAIPIEYTKEEVFKYPLPESQNPYCMSSRIVPQHPLAVLELCVDDGWFTDVSSHDEALLEPLYKLPYKTYNEEAMNRAMNAQLRRIQDVLRKEVPAVSADVANEVQWSVWHALFRGNNGFIEDATLHSTAMRQYRIQSLSGKNERYSYWNPYTQE